MTPMTNKINHLAVWVLVIVHQLVGWGWYTIFGEKWLNLHARTMTDIERTHSVGAYVLAIVTAIIVNYALAWLRMLDNPDILFRFDVAEVILADHAKPRVELIRNAFPLSKPYLY